MRPRKKQHDWQIPVTTIPLRQMYPDLAELREYRSKQVVVSDNKERRLFNVVSDRYTLVRHQEALNMVDREIKNIFGSNAHVIPKITSLNQGSSIRAEFNLQDYVDPVSMNSMDKIDINFQLFNSYDGRFTLKGILGTLRLVCNNGATVGEAWATISSRHFGRMGGTNTFGIRLQSMLGNISLLEDRFNNWKNVKIAYDDPMIERLNNIIAKKYTKPLGLRSVLPASKWDVWNMFTAMTSHKVKSPLTKLNLEYTISKAFYGNKDN